MHTMLLLFIGILIGGAIGTAAMCFVQVSRCAECGKRQNEAVRDGK